LEGGRSIMRTVRNVSFVILCLVFVDVNTPVLLRAAGGECDQIADGSGDTPQHARDDCNNTDCDVACASNEYVSGCETYTSARSQHPTGCGLGTCLPEDNCPPDSYYTEGSCDCEDPIFGG
jgi:hypothetical protein